MTQINLMPRLAPLALDIWSLPGTRLAEDLYGHAWRRNVVFSTGPDPRSRFYYTRTLPDPIRVARYLRPLVDGILIHDGRARSRSRTTGWWIRSGESGRWEPTEPDAMIDPIVTALDAMYALAVAARAQTELNAEDGSYLDDDNFDAAVTIAVLEALVKMWARPGPTTYAVIGQWRSTLRAPDEVLDQIACHWLVDTFEAGDLAVGPSNRLITTDVLAASEHDLQALPRSTLFRALDRLLGPRRKSGALRYWTIDRDVVVASLTASAASLKAARQAEADRTAAARNLLAAALSNDSGESRFRSLAGLGRAEIARTLGLDAANGR